METKKVPEFKYIDVAKKIVGDLKQSDAKIDQRLPSVKQLSIRHGVSRDTILRAEAYLKRKKILKGVRGKGHYLTSADLETPKKLLCIFNRICDYKKFVFDSIVENLDSDIQVELTVYNYDPRSFANILSENAGAYDYFIVMPHFKNGPLYGLNAKDEQIVHSTLKEVSLDKLFLIDNYLTFASGKFAAVFQDFSKDICESLKKADQTVRKYEKVFLVYPEKREFPQPDGIIEGFQNYCTKRSIFGEIEGNIEKAINCHSKNLLIILDEDDLVEAVKMCKRNGKIIGKDIGIIAYNDHPMKELMGISTFSTNFKVMGEKISDMISRNDRGVIRNEFNFLDRGSA